MSPERFEHLLTVFGPLLTKKSCRSRQPISAAEWLMVTLRFLTTGDSQQSQSFLFRIGRATVSHIIRETCAGIWTALQGQYVIAPKTSNDWVGIANEFKEEWHFLNCIGAIDGKHAMMECPKNGVLLFIIIRDSIASSCWLFVMPNTASLYWILKDLDLQTMPVYCPGQT